MRLYLNDHEVRAILNGSKTHHLLPLLGTKDRQLGCDISANELAGEINLGDLGNSHLKTGDIIRVCEAFDFVTSAPGDPNPYSVYYWADGAIVNKHVPMSYIAQPIIEGMSDRRRLSAITMPTWASRITLEVTSVQAINLSHIGEDHLRLLGNTSSDLDRANQDVTISRFVDLWRAHQRNGRRNLRWGLYIGFVPLLFTLKTQFSPL